jgi:hypothetical protein
METKKPSRAPLFLFGLVLGILGAIFLPTYVRPYIPQWVMGTTIVVKGTVAAKQKKENAVLLTVDTPEGVLLATFNKKVDEINLLINEKDTIEFTLPKYVPFIDDPRIIRVVRDQQATPEQAPAEKPQEQGTKAAKPGHQEKLPAAAPAPGATEHKPLDRK